jgi:hypothetical protein
VIRVRLSRPHRYYPREHFLFTLKGYIGIRYAGDIARIEGPPKSCDVTRWAQFTDIKDIKKEMLHRVEIRFENWLNA